MKWKQILALGMVVVLGMATTACGQSTKNVNSNDKGTKDLNGTVTITGSTSVEKILLDMIDEFQAINPDVKVNYTGTGSSAGIQDAIDGVNSLGASSRLLKPEEEKQGLKTDVFAYDGIAIAVHPTNKIKDISTSDLAKVYSGQITDWSELGGEPGEIVVVSREGASGTRGAFEELIGLEDAGGLTEDATVVEGNGNLQNTVAHNTNAIGYVSFSFINDTVHTLSIEGIAPTGENAKAGTYKLARPFLFTYKPVSVTPETQAFLDFTKTEDAQAYVEAHGAIKIN